MKSKVLEQVTVNSLRRDYSNLSDSELAARLQKIMILQEIWTMREKAIKSVLAERDSAMAATAKESRRLQDRCYVPVDYAEKSIVETDVYNAFLKSCGDERQAKKRTKEFYDSKIDLLEGL